MWEGRAGLVASDVTIGVVTQQATPTRGDCPST